MTRIELIVSDNVAVSLIRGDPHNPCYLRSVLILNKFQEEKPPADLADRRRMSVCGRDCFIAPWPPKVGTATHKDRCYWLGLVYPGGMLSPSGVGGVYSQNKLLFIKKQPPQTHSTSIQNYP